MRGDSRSQWGAGDWDSPLLRLGAQGGGTHGLFGSVSRAARKGTQKKGNGVRGQKGTWNMTTKMYSSGVNSRWWVRNRYTPAPPNRGGHLHENQLQIMTSTKDKRCSHQFFECDGGKETALHEVHSGI